MSLSFKEKYEKEILPALQKSEGYKTRLAAPRITKIVVNRGVGEVRENPKAIDVSAVELAEITGQKPLVRKCKKSIATFKVREGLEVGLKVTLRGKRMYDFLSKLINFALPKIRDFKGVDPKSFDGRGNYSLGLKEQLIFPEVDYEKVDRTRGMDVTFVTTAKSDQEARKLLEAFGLPFRKEP